MRIFVPTALALLLLPGCADIPSRGHLSLPAETSQTWRSPDGRVWYRRVPRPAPELVLNICFSAQPEPVTSTEKLEFSLAFDGTTAAMVKDRLTEAEPDRFNSTFKELGRGDFLFVSTVPKTRTTVVGRIVEHPLGVYSIFHSESGDDKKLTDTDYWIATLSARDLPTQMGAWPTSRRAFAQAATLSPAIEELNAAIAEHPNDDSLYVRRGNANWDAKRILSAINDYTAALAVNPNNRDALLRRAAANAARRNHAAVIADANRVLALDAESAPALLLRSEQEDLLENTTAAITDAYRAFEIRHTAVIAVYLGLLLNKNERWADAEKVTSEGLEVAQEDSHRADLHCIRGEAFSELWKWSEASADFETALRLQPHHLKAHVGRAKMNAHLGYGEAALKDANEALAQAPNQTSAVEARAMAHFVLRHWDEACADVDRYVALEFGTKRSRAYLQTHLVNTLIDAIRANDRDFGKRAIIADLTDAIPQCESRGFPIEWMYAERGAAYLDVHDNSAAVADYTKAITANPDTYTHWKGRATAYQRLGRHEQARDDFAKALGMEPLNQTSAIGLATCNAALGKWRAAMTGYERCVAQRSGHAPYPILLLIAMQLRAGAPVDAANMTNEIAHWPEGWPKTIGRFLLGDIAQPELMTAAEEAKSDDEREGQRCEAGYYAAVVRLGAADLAGARPLFEKAIATKKETFTEYTLAFAELRRLQ